MFWKKINKKSIWDYIFDIKQELYLTNECVANLEYEIKKIYPDFTKVEKEGDFLIKLQKDLSKKIKEGE